MLTLASIEQELNIITTVAYKCCADHYILTSHDSPLVTAPTDGSHSSLVNFGSVSSLFLTITEQSEPEA